MRGAYGAEVIRDPGRGGVHVLHRGILGIEEAEGVRLEAPPLQLRQVRLGPAVVGDEGRKIGGPAGRVADRVEEDLHVGQAGVAVEARAELHQLRVDRRSRVADRLDVPLPELPEATRLRPVVAEHRAGKAEPHRLRPRLHPVLDVGPANAGGRLRAQRPRLALLAAAGQDAEQLLLDDVGDGADAALEDGSLLEERRLHVAVAVAGGKVAADPLEARERDALIGQEIPGAPGGAKRWWHRAKSSRAARGDCRLPYPRSRWTERTSLTCSIRLMTRASCDTDATWSVAITVAV